MHATATPTRVNAVLQYRKWKRLHDIATAPDPLTPAKLREIADGIRNKAKLRQKEVSERDIQLRLQDLVRTRAEDRERARQSAQDLVVERNSMLA